VFHSVVIETPRLRIRSYTMDDLPAVLAVVRRPEVMGRQPEGVMSPEEARSTLEFILASYDAPSPEALRKLSLAVTLKDGGELIGWVGLGRLDIDPSETEIYYGLSDEHWGKGYATEAAGALLAYGFGTLGLDRIVAVVLPDNPASERVLRRIGLRYEKEIRGLPPEHAFFEGVRYHALGREEFLARQVEGKGAGP
jgi:ribosomal-protein-alanine N-acetyltransferase